MSEILQALAIGAGILFPVMIVVLAASIASVRRGEGGSHHGHHESESGESASGPVAETAGVNILARFLPQRDPTVLEILVLGTVIFTVTMGLLFAYSMMGQMR